ncbi:MAG: hypothetical protein OQJ89_02710, partial [Kangiellaceae bacterium]|nr:hypothetical protein [Kangiellaceae bacterium]
YWLSNNIPPILLNGKHAGLLSNLGNIEKAILLGVSVQNSLDAMLLYSVGDRQRTNRWFLSASRLSVSYSL